MSENDYTLKCQNTILSVLPLKIIEAYIAKGWFVKRYYNKNEIIHAEGEPCKQIEIILQGKVVIERIGLEGDLMTINYLNSADIIGANLVFSSTAYYPMTITAKKPTEVIIINKEILFEICNIYPDFFIQFIKIISDMSVMIVTKMKNRISRTIRQSIITYINKQYELQGTYLIKLTMSKKALAEMFGISRTSLSREFQKMVCEGLLKVDSKYIEVLNKDIIE